MAHKKKKHDKKKSGKKQKVTVIEESPLQEGATTDVDESVFLSSLEGISDSDDSSYTKKKKSKDGKKKKSDKKSGKKSDKKKKKKDKDKASKKAVQDTGDDSYPQGLDYVDLEGALVEPERQGVLAGDKAEVGDEPEYGGSDVLDLDGAFDDNSADELVSKANTAETPVQAPVANVSDIPSTITPQEVALNSQQQARYPSVAHLAPEAAQTHERAWQQPTPVEQAPAQQPMPTPGQSNDLWNSDDTDSSMQPVGDAGVVAGTPMPASYTPVSNEPYVLGAEEDSKLLTEIEPVASPVVADSDVESLEGLIDTLSNAPLTRDSVDAATSDPATPEQSPEVPDVPTEPSTVPQKVPYEPSTPSMTPTVASDAAAATDTQAQVSEGASNKPTKSIGKNVFLVLLLVILIVLAVLYYCLRII